LKHLFIPIFLLAAGWLSAQTPAYLHYDVGDGLPSALVYCVKQDYRGLLWFGTDKGLARFDGSSFKVFSMKDGLPDPEVLSIFEDSRQRLWLSCFHKKPCYRQGNRFVTANNNPKLDAIDMASGIFNYFEDSDGAIWVSGDYRRFCRWTPDDLQCFANPVRSGLALKESKIPVTISKISRFGNQVYAFGISWIEKVTGDKTETVFNRQEPFHSEIGSSPAMSFNENFALFSYKNGIVLMEYAGGQFQESDRMKDVPNGNIFPGPGGQFWVCAPGAGAFLIKHKNGKLQKPQIFLKGKRISQVFHDREGTIWFCTLNEGVYALPKNSALTYAKAGNPLFKSDNFTALFLLPDSTLVAGDDSGNLYFRTGNIWKSLSIGSRDGYNRVRQILPLPGNEWLAVTDETVFSSRDGKQEIRVEGARRHGASKSVYFKDGVTWLGNSYNLITWERDPGQARIVKPSRTTAVNADGEGNIWAGGLNGLFSQQDSFKSTWGDRFKPLGSRIIAMQQAGKNALWIATPDYGLLRVNVKNGKVTEVEEINKNLRAPVEAIQSIFTDPKGTVWMATNRGVFSLDKNLKVRHYDQKSGLTNNDVNAVLVQGDTLWAATVSGLSQILLRQSDEQANYPTYLTKINYQVGNKKIEVDLLDTLSDIKKITLPPGTSLLEVVLTGLRYQSGGNLHYEYLSEEELLPFFRWTWGNLYRSVKTSFQKELQVARLEENRRNFGVNVTPGKYRTVVTAILPDEVRSLQPDEWVITVLPHWWETMWFSLLLVVLLICFIWWLIRAGMAYRQMESTTSELQLQAIKAQINPHFIGNSINAIQQFFYPPDPIRASQYISIFSDLLRRTMVFSDKNFIPFSDELGYIKDYLEMIQLRFGDGFVFEITGAEDIPPGTPFPAMLLQPALENATLHGLSPDGKSRLKIGFRLNEGLLTCTILDNGIGIDTSKENKKTLNSKRPSMGLSLLNEKVQMLNRLHPLDLKLQVAEIGKNQNGQGGTQVSLSFLPQKIAAEEFLKPINQLK
jgi:ligand-binding sensor domain-containing protein